MRSAPAVAPIQTPLSSSSENPSLPQQAQSGCMPTMPLVVLPHLEPALLPLSYVGTTPVPLGHGHEMHNHRS
uniref:Uncharacterized protein n=1 Tax=Arundo donax TaxID=35708 RepID=A0A0A9CDZ6_ARUDO